MPYGSFSNWELHCRVRLYSLQAPNLHCGSLWVLLLWQFVRRKDGTSLSKIFQQDLCQSNRIWSSCSRQNDALLGLAKVPCTGGTSEIPKKPEQSEQSRSETIASPYHLPGEASRQFCDQLLLRCCQSWEACKSDLWPLPWVRKPPGLLAANWGYHLPLRQHIPKHLVHDFSALSSEASV